MKATLGMAVILAAFCAGCGSGVYDITVEESAQSATIRWTTTEDATGVIKFGETPDMGLKFYEESEGTYNFYNSGGGILLEIFCDILTAMICGDPDDDDSWDNEEDEIEEFPHSMTITGLRPGITYYFRIRVVTMDGSARQSHVKTFKTKYY